MISKKLLLHGFARQRATLLPVVISTGRHGQGSVFGMRMDVAVDSREDLNTRRSAANIT